MIRFNSTQADGYTAIEQCVVNKHCNALNTFLAHTRQNKLGIQQAQMMNFKTGLITLQIVHRMTTKQGNFVRINFCPFCGGGINPEFGLENDALFEFVPLTDAIWENMEEKRRNDEQNTPTMYGLL